jgi:PAS domain S-box-containing protein
MRRVRRSSTDAKIAVGFAAMFVVALAVGGVSWLSSRRLAHDLDAITGDKLPSYRYLVAAYAAQNDTQASLNGLALERDRDRRSDLEDGCALQLNTVIDNMRAYEALPHSDEQHRRWDVVRGLVAQWQAAAVEQRALEAERDRLLAAGAPSDLRERTTAGLHRLHDLDAVTDDALRHLVDQMNSDAEANRQTAMEAIADMNRALVGVILICGALTAALAWGIRRGLARNEAARRAEMEKALLARRLELITRYGSDIVLLCDRGGRVVEANERAVAAYGYAREEILERTLGDILTEPQGDIMQRFQGSTGGVVFEALGCRKDGSTFPAEVSSTAIDVQRERFYLGVARDITERKRADEQRAFQLTLLDTLHDAVIGVDTSLRVRSWNKAAERLYGWTAEEVLGRHVEELLGGSETGDVHCLRALQGPGAASHVCGELEQRRRDGARVEVQSEASAIRDGEGRVTGYLLANRDVAERRRAQEADAACRAKSRFLASMSHEIRTPLNAILGYSQLLVRDPTLGAAARRSLEIINRSGEHLLALINDILEMSKIEAGRATANPVTFDLHAMLHDLEAMFRLRAEGKGLVFRVMEADGVPPLLVADEGKVRQVLVNLLGNAMKFTNEGSVTLRVWVAPRESERPTIVAEVEDTGVGIASDEIGKLFQHFAQTESGRQAQSGTGLGLAISREHARLMGGDVNVVSSELGKGSLFRFEFAAEEAAGGPASRASRRRITGLARSGAAPPRVLIVDDQEANRGWLRQLLGTLGFEVREAASGEEAVKLWRAWRPELVLMDMRMPGMDGGEATRRIRREVGGADAIIIALTASVLAADREEVLQCGLDEFISKPVREGELLDKIQARLGLEYEYAEQEAPSRGAPLRPAALEPGALAAVAPAALDAMRAATTSGDIDQLRAFFGEVERAAGPAAASALRTLADRFDYDGLDRALGASETGQ